MNHDSTVTSFSTTIFRSKNQDPPPEKKKSHIRILEGFGGPGGLKYVAKKASILRPLAGFGRGRFRLYFGKQGAKRADFLQEPKRRVFRGFPGQEFYKRSLKRAYLRPGEWGPGPWEVSFQFRLVAGCAFRIPNDSDPQSNSAC